ncbi:hypothetical protein CROQUDRAFT_93131 [Cronartium quercuum f. sp. fusiforme G11]|uniref:Uncharacterized protein n=1 Tax=Cronartium quercuum f. sp. fusiforme G11 TaxID=708437 RepID=A0A9P6NFT3_9BASI|nr:hypothetical protein CROQUDRAFT_93131 [Cronartium quercuum f. sp. fusiforme G11]
MSHALAMWYQNSPEKPVFPDILITDRSGNAKDVQIGQADTGSFLRPSHQLKVHLHHPLDTHLSLTVSARYPHEQDHGNSVIGFIDFTGNPSDLRVASGCLKTTVVGHIAVLSHTWQRENHATNRSRLLIPARKFVRQIPDDHGFGTGHKETAWQLGRSS